MKRRIARWLRRTADRIDRFGAPKCAGLSFTIEPGIGAVLHGQLGRYAPNQPGCLLWYLNDEEYEKAYTEVVDRGAWIDTNTGQWRGVARP